MVASLKGKVAIVTGGAVRVGRAITLALADTGCDVFVHYGRSAGSAEETCAEAARSGVKVAAHSADLGDPDAVLGIVPAAIKQFGRIDILVNSAAIFPDEGLMETTPDSWDEQFGVNLRAPFFLCQTFASALGAGREGSIINILDARIFRPGGDHLAYRLTKSALAAMTEGLARELAPQIRVNAVALGAILPPPGEDEQYLEKIARDRVPLRRFGSPDLVAANVVHLLEQTFVTGVTIRLDGGEFL
jgi:glucose 1-dehydrogenase